MSEALESTRLTPLERDLLGQYYARHRGRGFPAPSQLTVASRQCSTAGRYVYLQHEGRIASPDGPLGLGTYSQFDIDGLNAGASFTVEIEDGKALYLEITVNGPSAWDGSERNWVVRDPDTGE